MDDYGEDDQPGSDAWSQGGVGLAGDAGEQEEYQASYQAGYAWAHGRAGDTEYAGQQDNYAGGHVAAGDDALSLALGSLVLHPELDQGAHVIRVGVHVYNNPTGRSIEEGELTLWINAEPRDVETGKDDGNAERNVFIAVQVPALEPKGTYPYEMPMQVDPGHWHVTATLWKTEGSPLGTSEGDVVVQGQHRQQVEFDDNLKHDLGVLVTHLTRVDTSLYQIHFVLNNLGNTPVPAGLPVAGTLESAESGMSASQQYDLPDPLAAGASVQTYLTVEGAESGLLRATIVVDPNGPSAQEDTLEVKAEEVQGASHGQGAAAHTDTHEQAQAHGGETGAKPAGGDVDDDRTAALRDKEEFRKRVDDILHGEDGVLTLSEIVGFFMENSEFAEVAEFSLGPAGDVIMFITLVAAVIDVFGEKGRNVKEQGFLFGLVWEAMGRAPVEPQLDPDDLQALGMLTPDERKEAFLEGVSEGQNTGSSEPKVHNIIAARIGYKMVHDHQGESSAGTAVLNEIAQARGISAFLNLDSPKY